MKPQRFEKPATVTRAEKDFNKFWFEFLKDPRGGELGEDISFCVKARECGYEIYADSSIHVGHIGNYSFTLQDYWYYRDEAVKSGRVVTLPLESSVLPKHEEYAIEVVG
jgi:hypothetical protein